MAAVVEPGGSIVDKFTDFLTSAEAKSSSDSIRIALLLVIAMITLSLTSTRPSGPFTTLASMPFIIDNAPLSYPSLTGTLISVDWPKLATIR